MIRLYFYHKVKRKRYKREFIVKKYDDIIIEIKRHAKHIRHKYEWYARVYIDNEDIHLFYTLDGILIYKEYAGTVTMANQILPETLCYDYQLKPIKNGDIVYCACDKEFYIMIADENKPDTPNLQKFIGLEDYYDFGTIWGVSQYFLTVVPKENVKALDLEYLYGIKKLFDEERFWEIQQIYNLEKAEAKIKLKAL